MDRPVCPLVFAVLVRGRCCVDHVTAPGFEVSTEVVGGDNVDIIQRTAKSRRRHGESRGSEKAER